MIGYWYETLANAHSSTANAHPSGLLMHVDATHTSNASSVQCDRCEGFPHRLITAHSHCFLASIDQFSDAMVYIPWYPLASVSKNPPFQLLLTACNDATIYWTSFGVLLHGPRHMQRRNSKPLRKTIQEYIFDNKLVSDLASSDLL